MGASITDHNLMKENKRSPRRKALGVIKKGIKKGLLQGTEKYIKNKKAEKKSKVFLSYLVLTSCEENNCSNKWVLDLVNGTKNRV